MNPLSIRSSIALAVVVFFPMVLSAGQRETALREGEVKQQQIQSDSKNLVVQLDAMIGEYERNGIKGDETEALKKLRAVLANLSESEMKRVIDLLQQARVAGDSRAILQQVASAYSGQKNIVLQMKVLMAQYQRNQAALDLSTALINLAERQSANMQSGIELGQWSQSKKPEEFDAALKASIDGQQSEQNAIAEEFKLLMQRVETFSKDPANKESSARFQEAAAKGGALASVLNTATEALRKSQVFKAIAAEKIGRDEMKVLAKMLEPVKNKAEMFIEAAQELEKLIEQEQELIGREKRMKSPVAANDAELTTQILEWLEKEAANQNSQFHKALEAENLLGTPVKKLADNPAVEKFISRRRNEIKRDQKDRGASVVALENAQGGLVTRADALVQDLTKDAKAAADSVKAAVENMQDARAGLNEANLDSAMKNQADAIANLQKAEALLKQMAEDEAKKDSGDPVAALQDAQKEVRELIAKQTQALRDASAPGQTEQQAAANAQQQAALKDKTAQVQQKAPTDAAPALGPAAADMQRAADALQNPAQRAGAQQAQSAALNNLNKADQQLGEKINKMKQAEQALAAAEQASQELGKLIQAEQKLQVQTVTAAAVKPPQPEQIKSLAPDQTAIQQSTASFQTTLPATAEPTVRALGHAQLDMVKAKTSLEQANGTLADVSERAALADLYKAQDAVKAQIQELQKELGKDQQQQQQQQAAQANQQVQKAQDQLAQAMQQMNQAAPQQGQQQQQQQQQQQGQQQQGQQQQQAESMQGAMQDLQKAAESVAAAAAQPDLSQAAQQALREAQAALADAMAQAAANDPSKAQENAAKAQDALAKAQAALALAQAGITTEPLGGPQQDGMQQQPGEQPSAQSTGDEGPQGKEEALQKGGVAGAGKPKVKFIGLPERERKTLEQSQSEKYPAEYAPMVEQYMENLATQGSK